MIWFKMPCNSWVSSDKNIINFILLDSLKDLYNWVFFKYFNNLKNQNISGK